MANAKQGIDGILTDGLIATIGELTERGNSTREVAKSLNVSQSTVVKGLKRYREVAAAGNQIAALQRLHKLPPTERDAALVEYRDKYPPEHSTDSNGYTLPCHHSPRYRTCP